MSIRIAFVVLVGLLLRFFGLRDVPFLMDEMISMFVSKHPQWAALLWDNHPPLFHLLLKGILYISPPDELGTRAFCILISCLTISIFSHFIFKYLGKDWGLMASFVFAINPVSIGLAQMVRPYALFELFSVLQFFIWLELLQLGRQSSIRKWLLFSVLSCLTHYLAIVPLSLQTFGLLIYLRNKQRTLPHSALITVAISGLSVLTLFRTDHLAWLSAKFSSAPITTRYFDFLFLLSYRSHSLMIIYMSILTITFALILAKTSVINKSPLTTSCLSYVFISMLIFISFGFVLNISATEPRFFAFLVAPLVFSIFLSLKNWAPKYNLVIGYILIAGIGFHAVRWYPERFSPARVNFAPIIKQIQGTKNSVVLTFLSQGIQTPYFERQQIPVIRIEQMDQVYPKAIEQINLGKKVWILDRTWGTNESFDVIRPLLQLNQLGANFYRFESGTGIGIGLLEVLQ